MDAILREKEREDKLQSAKKKLKSYRARQQSKSKVVSVPASPSKRNSFVAVVGTSAAVPASPVRKGLHAHKRSSSRAGSISVIMPSTVGTAGQYHNRRNSRRHSRNVSISFSAAANAELAAAQTASVPSSATTSGGRASPMFPTSASSPSLSSISNFVASNSASGSPSKNSFRQSVPHSFTASVAPNGRILSPSTSPVLQQGPQPSPNATLVARRSSLQMPKSPSFFEAQQLASSSSTLLQQAPLPPPSSHNRRPSRHTRKTSVATRRESMEIMSGLSISSFNFPSSPDPNSASAPYVSATGAFLASSDMSRSNTATSETSTIGASFSWPMEERQLSEEDERKNALQALEGRLTAPSEAIELPEEPVQSTSTSSRESKRASWNGNTIAGLGGKGATNLGMLVEEEEEEEEEDEAADSIAPLQKKVESVAPSAGARRQRPSSLIFPPSRALPFSGNNLSSYHPKASDIPISPTTPEAQHQSAFTPAASPAPRSGPRPLSLSASVSSPSLAADASGVKSARRQSGLRSLTLTSPEHVFNNSATSPSASPAPLSSTSATSRTGKRQSLLLNNNASSPSAVAPRPFSISSTSSLVSPDASRNSPFQFGRVRKFSNASNGSSALSNSQGPSSSSATPAKSVNRASLSYATNVLARSTPSPIKSAVSTSSPNGFPSANSRRYSEMSCASSNAFGFGDLVMEESVAEEDEEDLNDESILSQMDGNRSGKSDMLQVERPALERSASSSSSSEDPVILSMQVQALRSQVEHLRSEASSLQAQLSQSESTRKTEVDSLREEMSELREASSGLEEERDMLREDIDGWRTRCSDLERTLRDERARSEDERKEGLLLREKVRKLGDRLAASQASQSDPQSEDQALAAAQAKLIAEMRDQIFSLAAALERERLKSAHAIQGGASSRSTSPLLRALSSQNGDVAAMQEYEDEEQQSVSTMKMGRHHNESATSSNASSYNFSASSSSIHSGLGNISEDTSVADDDSIFGGSFKSPSSPAFSSTYSSYASSSVAQPANGISIHSSSTPLGRIDSAFGAGGLQTLAEEDEEETEEEEEEELSEQDEDIEELEEMDEEEEDSDRVPGLVLDDLRARTQSCSTSTGSNDHMPLTPVKETSPPMPHQPQQQQSKPIHQRSDSFIKQWAFPKGPVEPLTTEEQQEESFWNIYSDPLPPLPVTPTALILPPFSADISLDEDYFSTAFAKHANRPASLLLSQGGPPPSRSSVQAARLSSEIATTPSTATSSATPTTAGSRLSLQGFSSLWGWKTAPAPAPVQPEYITPFSSTSSASAFAAPPPLPPKSSVPRVNGGKRLLKLEASPYSRLDFTQSCACDGARVIRL